MSLSHVTGAFSQSPWQFAADFQLNSHWDEGPDLKDARGNAGTYSSNFRCSILRTSCFSRAHTHIDFSYMLTVWHRKHTGLEFEHFNAGIAFSTPSWSVTAKTKERMSILSLGYVY